VTDTRDIQTPVDDYELLDFGNGRRLERWGAVVVDRVDRLAQGSPALGEWVPDWSWQVLPDASGAWVPQKPGLGRAWSVSLDGMTADCELLDKGRVNLNPRDIPGRHWIHERLAGVYDLADIRVLNLFAGRGLLTEAAVNAGGFVEHVDSSQELNDQAKAQLGARQVEFIVDDVISYVESAIRLGRRYHMILISAPRHGYGPKGQAWDNEVDLPRLIKLLRKIVHPDCLGIWFTLDQGSWNPAGIAQLLQESLPGHTLQDFQIQINTVDGRALPVAAAACWFDNADYLLSGDVPLNAEQLEERIDPYMTSMGAAELSAVELAKCTREQQNFILHWVARLAQTSSGVALQFVTHAPKALRLLDEAGIEAWLFHCMDVYDTSGLHPAVAAFNDVENFSRELKNRDNGVALDDVINVLEAFVHGLNGRKLKIEESQQAYTDTETIYLPSSLNVMPDKDDNFILYKAMVVHQWAQTWHGTWQLDIWERVQDAADSDKFLRLFHFLETIRLDACVQRELPGMGRQMQALRDRQGELPVCPPWAEAIELLQSVGAGVADTLVQVKRLLHEHLFEAFPYQGDIEPQKVLQARTLRIERDKEMFRLGLLRMNEELKQRLQEAQGEDEGAEQESGATEFGVRQNADPEKPSGFTFEVTLDGKPLPPPEGVQSTIESIMQDLGEIPDEYLTAVGDGMYSLNTPQQEKDPTDVWKGTYHEEGAFIYNEWDCERQNYRKNWAVLRELEVVPKHDGFVAETLRKHTGLVKSLRRTFEALRGEDKLLKKQVNGDDVDIDALVEAYGDATAGMEFSERLFTKLHKLERNIAVMFMVDMSGSTKGWINDAEREALTLLCESLETLGDRYAIYGFSGMTRKRCEVYRVKRFDDPYYDEVRARISGIQPKDYTRMGVAIRHLSGLLAEVEAKTKLLITLSDGKPDDYDTYRGAYGIEDTRMALIEAKRNGIHPYCITIDQEARDYLPHMYGAVNYTVIDEVRKLPLKVSDIYRRLTS